MECTYSKNREKCPCVNKNEKVGLRDPRLMKSVHKYYDTIGSAEERYEAWSNYLKNQDFFKSGEKYPNVKVGNARFIGNLSRFFHESC